MADLSIAQFEDRLLRYERIAELGDFSHAIAACAPVIADATGTRPARQAAPDGTPWPPRKDPRPKHPLLILTGRMLRAAVGGGPGHVADVGPRSGAWGVSLAAVPYARAQQRGYPARNLPARRYLGIDAEHRERVRGVLTAAVIAGLRGGV